MRKLLSLVAAGAIVLGTASAATAATTSVTASLSVAIGTLPPAAFTGSSTAATTDGQNNAATLPSGSISGAFQTAISPPLIGILDGIGVAAPGLTGNFVQATAPPAENNALDWNGTSGTMNLNASAYLLMAGAIVAEIPLGVVGVGGTQMFHVLTLVGGTINANPYQLGMITLMGSLNTTAHTLTGTGVDNRTAGGSGTLTLVSPTNVNLGALGALASIATLTLNYGTPEPSSMLAAGAALTTLVVLARRRKQQA